MAEASSTQKKTYFRPIAVKEVASAGHASSGTLNLVFIEDVTSPISGCVCTYKIMTSAGVVKTDYVYTYNNSGMVTIADGTTDKIVEDDIIDAIAMFYTV